MQWWNVTGESFVVGGVAGAATTAACRGSSSVETLRCAVPYWALVYCLAARHVVGAAVLWLGMSAYALVELHRSP